MVSTWQTHCLFKNSNQRRSFFLLLSITYLKQQKVGSNMVDLVRIVTKQPLTQQLRLIQFGETIYPFDLRDGRLLPHFLFFPAMPKCLSVLGGSLIILTTEQRVQFPTFIVRIQQGKPQARNSSSHIWTYTFSISASCYRVKTLKVNTYNTQIRRVDSLAGITAMTSITVRFWWNDLWKEKQKGERITAGWKMGFDARGVCKSGRKSDSRHIMTTALLFLFRLWEKDQQGGVWLNQNKDWWERECCSNSEGHQNNKPLTASERFWHLKTTVITIFSFEIWIWFLHTLTGLSERSWENRCFKLTTVLI